MELLSVAVCDDERKASKYISDQVKTLFHSFGIKCKIDCFTQATELRKKILTDTPYRVLFLDISMPGLNGIQLGDHLRQNDKNSLIIYISGHDQYVFESFKVQPFRFIRKQYFEQEIEQTIADIKKELDKPQENSIVLNINKSVFHLNPYRTIYAEYNCRILSIYAENDQLNVRYNISDLEEHMFDYGFIRTHRSFLVNYRYIYGILNNEVILDNGKKLPISKHRLNDVKKRYMGLQI